VCYGTTTVDVTVTGAVTPTFDPIGNLCIGATAPVLPALSNNGINGTWNPAPSALLQLARLLIHLLLMLVSVQAPASIDITIAAQVTPVFTAIGPLCVGATAPILPAASNNGITGTWNPATISTAAAGTTTYTFTPDAGQCATATTTVDVTITGAVTPTFDPIGNLCIGATAPVLPALSNNGINGTWNPATISTAAAGTTTYTFTPDAGQCASSASIDITIATQVTPVFTAIGPLCVGATAPALPTLSNNGITGTWNPATISTAAAGTTTYTFTPDAGQCATATTTVDVTVTGAVTPTFDPIGNLCIGATAPVLPALSNNGINGTWNPATISTAAAGTTTYTFTPDAGQCASSASIDITIAAQVTPVFTAIGPLCVGATAPILPAASNNGITGTWNPATISTAAAGTTTYTFTPDAGQCATATTTVDVTITGAVTPTFDPIGNLCIGATAPVLPALSNNGINGTWNPATISTAAAGTTTYTFTPDAVSVQAPLQLILLLQHRLHPYLQLLVRFASVQRLRHCLRYLITVLPVPGTRLLSALLQPVLLLIHLLLMPVSVLRPLQLLM
jgi:hypothetical protein